MANLYKCLRSNEFCSDHYKLVPIREEDMLSIKEWRNAQMDVLRQKTPLSDNDQIDYYNKIIVPSFHQEQPSQILFSFIKKNTCIGYGGFVHICWEDSRAEVSFLLNHRRTKDESQYRNEFLLFLEVIKEVAFKYLKFNKLTGETYDIRSHHIAILEESGFMLEGRLENHNYIGNKYVDSLCHAFHKYDYLKSSYASKNILITSVSKKIPLIKCVINAAHKIKLNISIIGGDVNSNSLGTYFVNSFWKMPTIEELNISHLIKYCKNHNINAVIPTRDGELLHFAGWKKELLENGVSVMVSDKEVVSLCLDKLHFYKTLRGKHIPVIETSEKIDDIKSDLFVVKERYGAGALSAGLKLSKEEAAEHSRKLSQPIFQPYVCGDEVSVDMYIDKNSKIKGLVMRKRDVIIEGEAKVSTSFYDKNIKLLCENFVTNFDFYGHIIIQLLIEERNKFKFLECNPRFGGASSLSIAAGLDSFYWFLLEANGIDIEEYPFLYNRELILRQIIYPDNKIILVQ